MELVVSLINEKAKAPYRERHSVGYDVFAYGDHILSPGMTKIIPLGFHMSLPEGYGAFIWDRSSFGSKGIHIYRQLIDPINLQGMETVIFGGVIDWSYRGQMGAILHSFLSEPYSIKHGDRIAQFVIQKCELWEVSIIPMEELLEIPSERGQAGLGSTDGVSSETTQSRIIRSATGEEIFREKGQ